MTDHCSPGCPLVGCPSCAYQGEPRDAETESAPVTGAECATMGAAPGVASTNTKGLPNPTSPEGLTHMVANTHPLRTASVRGGADA